MPPIPPPAGIAGTSSLMLATTDSVVNNVDATLVAFCNALLVTLAGSRIPASTIFTYSSCNASNHCSQRDAVLLGRANGKCQAATAGQARNVSASVYGAGEVLVFLLCQCSWCAHRRECPTLQCSAPLYSSWVCSLAFFLQGLQGVPGK